MVHFLPSNIIYDFLISCFKLIMGVLKIGRFLFLIVFSTASQVFGELMIYANDSLSLVNSNKL